MIIIPSSSTSNDSFRPALKDNASRHEFVSLKKIMKKKTCRGRGGGEEVNHEVKKKEKKGKGRKNIRKIKKEKIYF